METKLRDLPAGIVAPGAECVALACLIWLVVYGEDKLMRSKELERGYAADALAAEIRREADSISVFMVYISPMCKVHDGHLCHLVFL